MSTPAVYDPMIAMFGNNPLPPQPVFVPPVAGQVVFNPANYNGCMKFKSIGTGPVVRQLSFSMPVTGNAYYPNGEQPPVYIGIPAGTIMNIFSDWDSTISFDVLVNPDGSLALTNQ